MQIGILIRKQMRSPVKYPYPISVQIDIWSNPS